MESKRVTSSSILKMARAAQAAHAAECERLHAERVAKERQELFSEWKPIADSIITEIRAQLNDSGTVVEVEDEETSVRYYSCDDWVLVQPAAQPSHRRSLDRNSQYRPLKLTIGFDICIPVMCWSTGDKNAKVKFAPATITIDDSDDWASLWVGADDNSRWEIESGNHNLLLAIALAADKQTEYVTKAHKVESINEERSRQNATPAEPTPEPAAPKRDNLESAGEILRRFAGGEYCVSAFDEQTHDDWNLKNSDNRAFLIASQIHALAVEVRELRNTMENRP